MFYISQLADDDCGFACLKMLLANINKDKSFLFLTQDEGHGPYSFKELVDIGEKYQVSLLGVKISKEQLKSVKEFPFIATVAVGESNHAVVVNNIRFGFVTYLDPECGIKHVTIAKFLEIFLEKCLIIKEASKASIEKVEFYSTPNKLILYVLQVLSAVFCILGVYFFGNESFQYLSIVFLIAFLVFEIALRLYLVYLMKIMDTYFENYIVNNNVFSIELLKRYEDYKKHAITSGVSTMFAFISSIFIIVIFLLNNYQNYIFVIVVIALAIIQSLVINPYLKNKTIHVANKERQFVNVQDVDTFIAYMHDLHEESYKIGGLQISIKYINIVLIVLVTYLTMVLSKISSTNYLLFNICFEVYLFQQLVSVFSFQNQDDEAKKSKCRLLNLLINKAK